MFAWAISLLTVGIVAVALGFAWFAGSAANIAWLFVVGGLVVFVALAVTGRSDPPSEGRSDARPQR